VLVSLCTIIIVHNTVTQRQFFLFIFPFLQNGTIRKLGYGFMFTWLCLVSFPRSSELLAENRVFSYYLHSTPSLAAGSHSNIAIPFGREKLECCGYPMVKKFDDMFSRFDRISACDRQMDGQTDEQTSCDSVVRAMHSIAR